MIPRTKKINAIGKGAVWHRNWEELKHKLHFLLGIQGNFHCLTLGKEKPNCFLQLNNITS